MNYTLAQKAFELSYLSSNFALAPGYLNPGPGPKSGNGTKNKQKNNNDLIYLFYQG